MNRVFLSGTINSDVKVYYSPRGEKICIFSLLVDDGMFSVEVVCKYNRTTNLPEFKKTDRIMLSGALARTKKGSPEALRLEADKLFVMEV
ncbi:MAG: hypothetical protein KBE27_02285 [Syntrophorhabdaceae bacterium]|nr:hypothetical protein [Syntrophorhabdales bacterium]MBP9560633.1 hypothetical protein [Syntrophorhabdaceae bacterium]